MIAMNKKTQLSISLLSLLMCSIMFADLTKGVLISDQLEVKNGSYVEGKVFKSNSTLTDELFSYTTITVENIFTTADTSEKLIQISIAQDLQPDFYSSYPGFLLDTSKFEMTHLVFYDNRTTFLPMARIYLANATESVEISLLGYTKISEMMDINNTKVTFSNGTSYILGSASLSIYSILSGYINYFSCFEYFLSIEYEWTLLTISPIANIGDTVNYNNVLGNVVGKPAVTTSLGESYDTIQVKYVGTSLFGMWDATEVNAFYDIETGFLIKIIEEDSSVKYEFIPGEIKFGSALPFPTAGIVLGLAAIGLIAYYYKKK